MKKKFIIIAILFIVAAIAALRFVNKETKSDFVTKKLILGDITETVTASGTINPISQVDVGSQVSGRIKDVFVDYNSIVQKGELLAVIDPELFEANVAKEKANLNVAEAQVMVARSSEEFYRKNLERIKKLNKQNYSADKDLDEAVKNYDTAVSQVALYKAQVAQAVAALDYNSTQLGYSKIISPVSGMVVSKNIEAGQTVAASFETPTLFKVAEDLTKMKIEASVVEADVAKVREGQRVEFSVDSFPDEVFAGIVTQVRNEALNVSNVVTYIVIIEINNQSLKFKPGMTANVDIVTAEKKGILLAPNKALRFSMDNGNTRYKEKGVWTIIDGKPLRINVETGVYNEEYTEIKSTELMDAMDVIVDKSSSSSSSSQTMMRMPR